MAQNSPMVQEDTLIYQLDGQTQKIMLDTSAWQVWLGTASTFTFHSVSGTFSARKERSGNKRGGLYWKAYRRREGKLFSTYLGKSGALTRERLSVAATQLNGEARLASNQAIDTNTSGVFPLPALSTIHAKRVPQMAQVPHPKQVRFFNLPVQLTSLVGREQDIAQVCALLQSSEMRLLTLLGPGGVGKTRLALASATELYNEFTDGVVFVSLAAVRDSRLVISTIAQTLGLHHETLQDVKYFLQSRHLLLVLDNFEQVMSATPEIENLLLTCPQIKLLITSRAVLRLQGEHEFPVLPLSLPDSRLLSQLSTEEIIDRYGAIALFIQRVQALLPQFQLSADNIHIISEICTRLDGLPLAIELAVARIKLLPPQALLMRLSQSLSVLSHGARTLPERQQTLYNTIQWSYVLLNANEQQLFLRLSVFVGGCTLEAIAAVCGVEEGSQNLDTFSGISLLLDNSLISQVKQEAEVPRLTMLETVREYAQEQLQDHGDTENIRLAHARYYLHLAEEIAEHLTRGGQQLQWLRQLAEEQENLRAALGYLIEHRKAELAVQLSGALWRYWVNRGYFSEGYSWLAVSLGLPYVGKCTWARARALCGAGDLALRQGNYQVATALLEESVASYQELGEKLGLAEALLHLGLSLAYSQRFVEAHTLIEQSIALSREAEDQGLLGHALDSLTRLAWKQGNMEATRALAEENLRTATPSGEIRAQISPRKLLATVALIQGDYTRAAELAQELLTISQDVGDRESEFSALYTLGTVSLRQGDDEQAHALYNQCLNVTHEIGSARNTSMVFARLGEVAFEQGNNALATRSYRESLSNANTFEDKEVVGVTLLGLARIAKGERRYWRAAHMLGAAEVRINTHIDLDAMARVVYERDVSALRAYLGEEEYTHAHDQGSKMKPEQVLTIPEPPPTRTPELASMYPDKLTKREVDVLRLVASGLTDAQVAKKLVVSPRTVQGHLRSIYSKLQVNSRSAATHYVVEHKLL